MKKVFLGIDTSNYTTSACLMSEDDFVFLKTMLSVRHGEKGVRQSEAVFQHTKNLPSLIDKLFSEARDRFGEFEVCAVGVSTTPRRQEGSYMPCFLAGAAVAKSLAALNGIPAYPFSHQSGHVRAAAYSCGGITESPNKFIAFHVSGGTTEILLYENGTITLLGGTEDLNAGQLIDRVGVAMGMMFPCGEEMERLAEGIPTVKGIKVCVRGLTCNLSGIENQAIGRLKQGESREHIAAFTLDAVLKTLDKLTEGVVAVYPDLPILYAGGVMSCKRLQNALGKKYRCYFATPELSGDNAVGTALLALEAAVKSEGDKENTDNE